MNKVEPIRDEGALLRCYDAARAHDANAYREHQCSWELLLALGLNTGLRISDLLTQRVGDVRGQKYIQGRARKTGKEYRIYVKPDVQRVINRLTAGRDPGEYVFQSLQRDPSGDTRPISRQWAWRIIQDMTREAGITDRVGCHTLRKTFGYHHYQQFHDEVTLQKMLQHSYTRETLRYIGIEQDQLDETQHQRKSLLGR